MIIHEIDDLCLNCPSMGLPCQGAGCRYSQPIEYDVIACTNCKNSIEDIGEYYYIVDGEELCEDCAFEWFFAQDSKKVFEEALRYIDHDKQLQVDFYLNWVCGSNIFADIEKVSDKVIEIVKKECTEFPNMLYDDLKEFCAEDKDDFLSFFYERKEL